MESRYSVSPVTGVSYSIPKELNDKEGIDDFLEGHPDKPVVAVQGLGFVGAVMGLVCANAMSKDYAVIGVDLPNVDSYWRIQSLNDGVFPLTAEDPKIEKFYSRARERKNFYSTYDAYAYAVADVIVVDINLDVDKRSEGSGHLVDYDVDLSGFRKAMAVVGKNCKEDVLILVETTVPPGTCEMIVSPIIEKELKDRGLRADRFRLGHSYERVMPGPNYIDSIRTFPRVYSGINEESAKATKEFLKTIIDTVQCPLTQLESTNATEMAKVLENAYRAMNIAFVAEWSRFAEAAGVDLYAIVNAIRQRPTHANLMYPGIGVGGYCLTKDPLLANWSLRALFDSEERLDCSESAVRINDRMPVYAYDFLCKEYGNIDGARILLLGVTYRGEVGDTRFSPVDLFYDCLADGGAQIVLHDPYVSYWPEKNRQVYHALTSALAEKPDIVIIATGHKIYKNAATIKALMEHEGVYVYDTIGSFSAEQIVQLRTRNTVKVLGRGDL